jgi:peptide methionine sulfoxide reductase msrA/msrB
MKSKRLIAVITAVLLLLTGCSGNIMKNMDGTQKAEQKEGSQENAIEIDFTLPDTNGNMVHLADLSGKKVYIKFWATWCSICLAGIEEFSEFNDELSADSDTAVLTIVSPNAKGEMSSEDFKAWFQKRGYDFTVLLDEDGEVAQKYGVRAFPTSVLINTQGKIARNLPGHLSNELLSRLINELI